jgi:hypothetical protein
MGSCSQVCTAEAPESDAAVAGLWAWVQLSLATGVLEAWCDGGPDAPSAAPKVRAAAVDRAQVAEAAATQPLEDGGRRAPHVRLSNCVRFQARCVVVFDSFRAGEKTEHASALRPAARSLIAESSAGARAGGGAAPGFVVLRKGGARGGSRPPRHAGGGPAAARRCRGASGKGGLQVCPSAIPWAVRPAARPAAGCPSVRPYNLPAPRASARGAPWWNAAPAVSPSARLACHDWNEHPMYPIRHTYPMYPILPVMTGMNILYLLVAK